MTRAGKLVLCAIVIAVGLRIAAGACLAETPDLPQFRWPDGQGQSSAKELPLTWSEPEIVAWRVPIGGLGCSSLEGKAAKPLGTAGEHIPAQSVEPLVKTFSLERAARSLDTSAAAWHKQHQCSQCHANFMYLIARPALRKLAAEPTAVRDLYEWLVRDKWEKTGLRYPSEAMVVAVPLAFHDRQTTAKLHPLTRKALDRMLTHQRPDGGWNGIGGAARTFINEYEETLLAALGIAAAPERYAETPAAKKALDGIRSYARAHSPVTPYQKGMLIWAGHHVPGLMTDAERKQAVEQLLGLQRADGGWALARLVADEDTTNFKGGWYANQVPSDGYGTGFVLFAARQAGIPAHDPRLRRAIGWLKTHQRASGRWFTPSLNHYTKQNLPSNSGTAFAVLALVACGELGR